jgi:hypothetical protein
MHSCNSALGLSGMMIATRRLGGSGFDGFIPRSVVNTRDWMRPKRALGCLEGRAKKRQLVRDLLEIIGAFDTVFVSASNAAKICSHV